MRYFNILILAIILMAVGIALLVAPSGFPYQGTIGLVLLIVGVIVLVIWIALFVHSEYKKAG